MNRSQLVVISGLSGSGKSSALKCFEDLGYYCVDNLPPPLIPTFVDLCHRAGPRLKLVALVVDARTREFLEQFVPIWNQIKGSSTRARLLFFDADDNVLMQRFSETRRPHPLAPRGALDEGIAAERKLLEPVREAADDLVDTSTFSVRTLREMLSRRFGPGGGEGLNIAVASFAYRNGILDNADLVFDVRFLPNPHYVTELRPRTGLDKPVREFVESRTETREFLQHLERLLRFLIPQYAREGKTYLTLAFGCTGGRHRSVAIASMVAERLRELGYDATETHVDLEDAPSKRRATR